MNVALLLFDRQKMAVLHFDPAALIFDWHDHPPKMIIFRFQRNCDTAQCFEHKMCIRLFKITFCNHILIYNPSIILTHLLSIYYICVFPPSIYYICVFPPSRLTVAKTGREHRLHEQGGYGAVYGVLRESSTLAMVRRGIPKWYTPGR